MRLPLRIKSLLLLFFRKEDSSFFEKKEAKKLLPFWVPLPEPRGLS
jgi:hypothetical protein